jgi:hypothetical protein
MLQPHSRCDARKESHVGAVALGRAGDLATGDFSEAQQLLVEHARVFCCTRFRCVLNLKLLF